MADRAALAVGRQLAHPDGLVGLALGAVMRIANRRPTRALLEALDIKSEHHVLDIGCGDGVALQAAQSAARRCGVDRSRTMVESARRRLRREIAAGRADVRVGDMSRLPYGDDTFDRIIASNMLYFCDDVAAFLAECRRVARDGGLLGVYVTDERSMAGWRFAGPATHRHFGEASLRKALRETGVEAEDLTITSIPLPGGMTGLIAIVRLVRAI